MKFKFLILFILLTIPFIVNAQTYDRPGNWGIEWKRGMFDTSFRVPLINTNTAPSTTTNSVGFIKVRPADSSLYLWKGLSWIKIYDSATLSTALGTYMLRSDSATTGTNKYVTPSGVRTIGDAAYIINSTSQQSSSNFNISGSGVIPILYGSTVASGDLKILPTSNATQTNSYVKIFDGTATTSSGVGINLPDGTNAFTLLNMSFNGTNGITVDNYGSTTTDHLGLYYARSARGTQASPTIVGDGDVGVRFQQFFYNGSAFLQTGKWEFVVDETPVSGQRVATRWDLYTNPTNTGQTLRLRVTKDGYLLRGTTTNTYSSTMVNSGTLTSDSIRSTLFTGQSVVTTSTGVFVPAPDTTAYIITSAGTLSPAVNTKYGYNGTTSTWTLPTLAGNGGKWIEVANFGSGAITVNSNAGGNDIFTSSAVNTTTVNVGEVKKFFNYGSSGAVWKVE